MTATAGNSDRLNAYRRLSRLLFPQRYIGKILLLTFIAAHIPLLALVVYTVFVSGFDTGTTVRLLAVGLVATLVGTTVAMAGLWVLLTPVVSSSRALERYRDTGERLPLPVDVPDEGGRLLANVHGTLEGLDTTIARLEVLATRDGLTGVYNRREGTRRLIEACHNHDGAFTLILLDADGLKAINDQWGHSMGDRVLQRFATVIAHHVGDDGWVARWGGDEFVCVVSERDGRNQAEGVVAGVLTELERGPLRLDGGQEIRLRLSTGMARHAPGDDLHTLFNRADIALYQSKPNQARHRRQPVAEASTGT